ncbi:purine-cytosine permease family protein [Nocardioides sp.]|uniref:purine-cytosine permease family protein n=1 Tax=Nocardioides sp. TaxID=35761 RepID=UPI003D0D2A53
MSKMVSDEIPQANRIEHAGVDVIAESARHGHPHSLFWPWCAANVAVLAVSWGGYVIGFGINLTQALLVTLIGVVASFLLVGLASLAGQKGSAPTLVLSRASFGIKGNWLPGLVSWLLLVGWETSLCALAALSARTVSERLAEGSGDVAAAVALVLVAGSGIYYGVLGFEAIMRAQRWLTIATLALTAGFIALTMDEVHLGAAFDQPAGSTTAVIGALVMLVAGFGVGWINCAADYSRYLPRDASKAGIVGWTTFGGALPVVLLAGYGLLLCASDPALIDQFYDDPIGALTPMLPTWYLLPFIAVALLGLAAGVIIDIYSSGLTLVATGIPIQRPVAAALDGVLMTIGAIYVVWFAPNFLVPFQGFLITVGVPLAAWGGIFVADLLLRKERYDEVKLFDESPQGYGVANPTAIVIMLVGTVIGWGLVTNSLASWLTWQGYLLGPLGLGGKSGDWAYANIGVLVALAIGFVGYLVLCGARVRAQESKELALTSP